jgi:hypothetical protein
LKFEERIGVMKRKRDRVITLSLMGDDVVTCMKIEMKLMIVSGYQLYKLYRYRLIKYKQFIVFLRIEQLIGVVGHLVL